MGRPQKKITFQIGTSVTVPDLFKLREDLAAVASRQCGGCTTSVKQGWWIDGAEEPAATFEGRPEQEVCIDLEVTCEPAKYDKVLGLMKRSIAIILCDRDATANWVHVSVVDMIGEHFSVKELLG